MELQIRNTAIYLLDGMKVAGYVSWSRQNDAMIIEHTFVDPAYRGQGLARRLMEEAVKKAKGEGSHIVPICSYAKSYLEKNPM